MNFGDQNKKSRGELLCCKISCKWVHKVLPFLSHDFSIFSDLSKKINKQLNKLGHCPGNEIKEIQDCYGLLIIITPQRKEVDFNALTINMPISDLKLIIDTSHSDLN